MRRHQVELDRDTERPVWGMRAIADVANCDVRKAYNLAAKGRLPVKKVGKDWVGFPSAIRAALRADSGEGA